MGTGVSRAEDLAASGGRVVAHPADYQSINEQFQTIETEVGDQFILPT